MLEALIRTKNSACSDKRQGDVICVKLKDFADWGAMERRVHMVVDWEDDYLENEMREKNTTTVVTPYKMNEQCSINDTKGNQIFYGSVTKTRSKKYFDIQLEIQKEKHEQDILKEFEENKEFIKSECLKKKPMPKIDSSSINDNAEYLDYLNKMQKHLSSLNIKTKIIDGKIVRV